MTLWETTHLGRDDNVASHGLTKYAREAKSFCLDQAKKKGFCLDGGSIPFLISTLGLAMAGWCQVWGQTSNQPDHRVYATHCQLRV